MLLFPKDIMHGPRRAPFLATCENILSVST